MTIRHTTKSLVHNEEFGRKVIPFLKPEYFLDQIDKSIFLTVNEYVNKYNGFPSKEALLIELANQRGGINDNQYKQIKDKVEQLKPSESKLDWLLDQTEKFCKDKAIYNLSLIHI